MAESTLSPSYSDLRSEIGYFLGYGSTSGNWSSDQQTRINNALKAGQRKFFYPALPNGAVYEWRFMRPVTTLSLSANDYDYNLPDNFAGVEGDMTFATTDGVRGPVKQVSESMIRMRREATSGGVTGRPTMFAIRPRSDVPTTSTGTRWEAIFHPIPDAAYTLSYRRLILPDTIDSTNLYPHGGAQHGETIKACCLAAAEETLMDGSSHWKGIMAERLMASIKADRQLGVQFQGYNGDDSDKYEGLRGVIGGNERCTYEGVQYS